MKQVTVGLQGVVCRRDSLSEPGQHRLEGLDPPPNGGQRAIRGQAAAVGHFVVVEVGQQLPRLVFGGLDSGQVAQAIGVKVAVGDPGLQVNVLAVGVGDELDLVDLEAELVQAIDALGDPILLVSLDPVFRAHLAPEGVIAGGDVLAQMDVRFVDGHALLGGDVAHLTSDVLNHDLDVVLTAGVRQRVVDRRGLAVDQPGLDGARVEAIQNIAQGAVTPEASEEMELGQEHGEGVEELLASRTEAAAGKQLAIREGIVDVAGDEAGALLAGRVLEGTNNETDWPHSRAVDFTQPAQRLVIALGGFQRQLLDGIGPLLKGNEPHGMARDPAG